MRRVIERRTRARTCEAHFRASLAPNIERERGSGYPLTQWEADPLGYMAARLGIGVLMPHQQAIALSVRDNAKTAVSGGQKSGKSLDATAIALWFFECFEQARVVMTANTKTQIRDVLWRELKNRIRSAPVRIDGKWSDNPATGFRASDGREILGGTAREIEALAGVSGGNQLFIVDEASALSQAKAEALEGNTAGAGMQRMLFLSNPTRAEGPFFESFHARKSFFRTFQVDSEDVAKWHHEHRAEIRAWQLSTGRKPTGELPGVVTAARIAQWAEEYGKDSPFYLVRVKGKFPVNEAGKPITLHMIKLAQDAWEDEPESGELVIGLDPAGPGLFGDETSFAPVRGKKLLALFCFHGMTEDAIVAQLQGLLSSYRKTDDVLPRVMLDSEGPIGSALLGRLRDLSERLQKTAPGEAFEVYGVRASAPARREPNIYDRVRDELVANLARWLRDGGAIPKDHKLEVELHAASWIGQVSGKLKLTAKEDIREKIGRSPDRRDALALAAWAPAPWLELAKTEPQEQTRATVDPYSFSEGFDPYAFHEQAVRGR